MLLQRIAASVLLAAVPTTPVLADIGRSFDRDCWQRHEIAAAKIQRFKTMLLVGSLNCRDIDPYVMDDYNHFLRVQRPVVNGHQQIVRDRFMRKYGPRYGLTAFTDYETQLGNRLSSARHGRARCDMIASYARLAARVSPDGLADLAHSVDEEAPLRACPPAMHYAGGRWQPRAVPGPEAWGAETPPAPAALAESMPSAPASAPTAVAAAIAADRAAPPPPPLPVQVASAEWPDLVPVEPEIHPVTVEPNAAIQVAAVVSGTPGGSGNAADPAAALRAAIKSLTVAAEALEAERAGRTSAQ
jgi:hypothetical protein